MRRSLSITHTRTHFRGRGAGLDNDISVKSAVTKCGPGEMCCSAVDDSSWGYDSEHTMQDDVLSAQQVRADAVCSLCPRLHLRFMTLMISYASFYLLSGCVRLDVHPDDIFLSMAL